MYVAIAKSQTDRWFPNNCALLLVFRINVRICLHNGNYVRYALPSSALVPFHMTSRVCLKCVDSRSALPPIDDCQSLMYLMVRSNVSRAVLCNMLHSFPPRILHLFSTWTNSKVLLIPKIRLSEEIMSSGHLFCQLFCFLESVFPCHISNCRFCNYVGGMEKKLWL